MVCRTAAGAIQIIVTLCSLSTLHTDALKHRLVKAYITTARAKSSNMKWARHNSLSDDDFARLDGTPLMETLMRNRIVVFYDEDEEHPTTNDMGLKNCTGLYHIRALNSFVDEILFEQSKDMDEIEQHLTLAKMAMD
jgi:hypothetical protein